MPHCNGRDVVENRGLKFKFQSRFSIHLFHAMTRKYLCMINVLNNIQIECKTLDLRVRQFYELKLIPICTIHVKLKRIENKLWNYIFNPMFSTTSAVRMYSPIALWREILRLLWMKTVNDVYFHSCQLMLCGLKHSNMVWRLRSYNFRKNHLTRRVFGFLWSPCVHMTPMCNHFESVVDFFYPTRTYALI